ncbi:MAG: class I SAM-dependent methyltransferase [Planctomycetota bacterium]|jgi:SAM-dependent methyltransferase|nr:class I SAM-dependent methyltransferase [Planctomycetota bacterium]MDP6838243.1 class I SAM-dependent methyltransferase [Planctomycetota bacterium]
MGRSGVKDKHGKQRRKHGRNVSKRRKSVVDNTPKYTARSADKHVLYQLAVQSPETDVEFLTRVYGEVRGKKARHFREDFCGTAILSAEWVKQGNEFTAEGFDLCPETLAWGVEHNLEPLGDDAARVRLHEEDVRTDGERGADVRCAQNFSYQVFQEREELVGYLRHCREDLAEDGIFVLDLYGGPESLQEMEEERDVDGEFTYVWDQDEYWPGTGEYLCKIHFRFNDGSEMTDAFVYHWRMWSLTELKDALKEAGFADVHAYFEGTDDDGEGDGEFSRGVRGENCEAWIAYLVAVK